MDDDFNGWLTLLVGNEEKALILHYYVHDIVTKVIVKPQP